MCLIVVYTSSFCFQGADIALTGIQCYGRSDDGFDYGIVECRIILNDVWRVLKRLLLFCWTIRDRSHVTRFVTVRRSIALHLVGHSYAAACCWFCCQLSSWLHESVMLCRGDYACIAVIHVFGEDCWMFVWIWATPNEWVRPSFQ